MPDLLLRINSTFQDNASRGLLNMLNPINFIMGAFKNISVGTHMITTGFQSMYLGAGGGLASLRLGAGNLMMGILKLGAVIGLVAGIAAIAIGIVAVKAAADFQQGLNRLVTGAGDVTDNMQLMGQAILGVSVNTGVAAGELLKAMYLIISSGQRGAQAIDTLTVASKGAVIEQANVADVANVLSGVMTNYGTKTYNATQFMNGLIVAVQQGKITLQDLAVAMGPLDPIAKNLGISINDVAAAMTTQTNAMVPAARAATGLRFMMLALENPTHKAIAAMKAMGLSSVDVANEMKKSLPGALDMIYHAALRAGPEGSVAFNRAFQDMVGGLRSFTAATALTGSHMKDFVRNSQLIKAAMEHNKTAVIGWDVAQKGFNVTMSKAHAALNAVLITIGTALLPALTRIVAGITPVLTAFAQWIIKSHVVENVISALGVVFSTVGAVMSPVIGVLAAMGAQFMKLVTWIQHNETAMLAFKILLIAIGVIIAAALIGTLIVFVGILLVVAIVIGVVIAVIMIVITVIRAFGFVVHWLIGVWTAFVAWIKSALPAMGAFFVFIWNWIKTTAINIWNGIVNGIKGILGAIGAWFVSLWNGIKNTAVNVWNAISTGIRNAVNTVVNWLKNAWQTCVNAIVGFFQWLYNHNYYWQGLVDTIRNAVANVTTWLKNVWQTCVITVVSLWNWIKNTATTVWHAVTTAISTAVNAVVTWLKGAWNNTVAWIGARWHDMVGLAQTAWNAVKGVFNAVWGWMVGIFNTIWTNISSWWTTTSTNMQTAANTAWTNVSTVFSNAWSTYISGPLTTLGTSIGTWASNLATTAISWGVNLIQGIINGINSMLGALGSAAQNAFSVIAKFLGFHSPAKEGEGRYIVQFGENMIKGFMQGMKNIQPQLQTSLNLLVKPLGASGAPPVNRGNMTSSAPPVNRGNTTGSGGVTVVIQAMHINDFGPNMPHTIANTITDLVATHLGSRIRIQSVATSSGNT